MENSSFQPDKRRPVLFLVLAVLALAMLAGDGQALAQENAKTASNGPAGLPLARVQRIINYFDASVAHWMLVGKGVGHPAVWRRGALRGMIVSAGDLLAAGDLKGACDKLKEAYYLCDRRPAPEDYVTGGATAHLGASIIDLWHNLGCR
jgi:hypothetical protein